MNNKADISVCTLILTYNEIEKTKQCINSVLLNDYEDNKVILIDNGSSDDLTKYFMPIYPDIDYIRIENNIGFSGAFNAGMKKVINENHFDYFWLVSNDLKVNEDCLSKLVEVAYLDNRIGFLGPETFKNNGSDEHDLWIIGLENNENPLSHTFDNEMDTSNLKMLEVEYVSGHCLLVKTDVIMDVGMMRDFSIYWEEREWQWRAKKEEWKSCVVPGSICFHDRDSFGKPNNTYMRTRNFIFFNRIIFSNKPKFIKYFLLNVLLEFKWSLGMLFKRKWNFDHYFNFIKGLFHGFAREVPGFEKVK